MADVRDISFKFLLYRELLRAPATVHDALCGAALEAESVALEDACPGIPELGWWTPGFDAEPESLSLPGILYEFEESERNRLLDVPDPVAALEQSGLRRQLSRLLGILKPREGAGAETAVSASACRRRRWKKSRYRSA